MSLGVPSSPRSPTLSPRSRSPPPSPISPLVIDTTPPLSPLVLDQTTGGGQYLHPADRLPHNNGVNIQTYTQPNCAENSTPGEDLSSSSSSSNSGAVSRCSPRHSSLTSDDLFAWACLAACFVIHFLMAISIKSFGVIYLELLDKFKATATATGWVPALCLLVFGFSGPVASSLCTSLSVRTVTIFGTLLQVAACIWTAYATSLTTLYFTLGVMLSIGGSFIYMPTFPVVNHHFVKRRALASGLSTSGSGVGTFAGPLIVFYLFNGYGFSGAMWLVGGLCLHGVVCAMVYQAHGPYEVKNTSEDYADGDDADPETPGKESSKITHSFTFADELYIGSPELSRSMGHLPSAKQTEEKRRYSNLMYKPLDFSSSPSLYHSAHRAGSGQLYKQVLVSSALRLDKSGVVPLSPEYKKMKAKEEADQEMDLFTWCATIFCTCDSSLLRDPSFVMLIVVNFGYGAVQGVTATYMAAYAVDEGHSAAQGALLLSIAGITDGVARLVLGLLLDMPVIKQHRGHIVNAIQLMGGCAIVALPMCTGYMGFTVISAIRGVSSGVFLSQRTTVATDIVGQDKVAHSTGYMMLPWALGCVFSICVGGLFRDSSGSYAMIFYIAGLASIISGVMFSVVHWKTHTSRCVNKQKQSNSKEEGRRKENGVGEEKHAQSSETDRQQNIEATKNVKSTALRIRCESA